LNGGLPVWVVNQSDGKYGWFGIYFDGSMGVIDNGAIKFGKGVLGIANTFG
jgi:hypothetical protein